MIAMRKTMTNVVLSHMIVKFLGCLSRNNVDVVDTDFLWTFLLDVLSNSNEFFVDSLNSVSMLLVYCSKSFCHSFLSSDNEQQQLSRLRQLLACVSKTNAVVISNILSFIELLMQLEKFTFNIYVECDLWNNVRLLTKRQTKCSLFSIQLTPHTYTIVNIVDHVVIF
jgi:hypothetical protein